jgi:ribosomal protein S18 acetylase RimI-like enzyme
MSIDLQEAVRSVGPRANTRRIQIRQATTDDNDGLIELTRATPMPGAISLRIDRDPDFFALLRMRGEALVYVAIYGGRLIGSISGTIHMAYVYGIPERVAYVGDLKVHPEFTGRRLSVRLIAALQAHLKSRGIDLTYNLVAKGNHRVSQFCATKHVSRAVALMGEFIVDEIIPSPFPRRSTKYRIAEAKREELPEIVKLIDCVRRKRMFGRVVTIEDLRQTFDAVAKTGCAKILVAREAGIIKATLTVENIERIKRNVLISVPPLLRASLTILRLAAIAIPNVNVPRVGGPLEMLYARYMACADGYEDALPPLLAEARVEALRRGSSFLSLGLHENDPYRAAVSGLPRFSFRSMAVSNSIFTSDCVRDLALAVPYADFALV